MWNRHCIKLVAYLNSYFTVDQLVKPTSPTNFTVTYCNTRTAKFTWRSGLSGQAPTKEQFFQLLYLVWHTSNLTNLPVMNKTGSVIKHNILNGSEDNTYAAQLSGLESHTRYLFAVYAVNANGLESELSQIASCTTVEMRQLNTLTGTKYNKCLLLYIFYK